MDWEPGGVECVFFFQAEDGIRDIGVTGVQTCALPISIRARTPVHLVLHGGSGVPPEMIQDAIRLPGGGISKVNIATDLEHAMLTALGRTERLSDEACRALPPDQMRLAQDAVERTVVDKIETYLLSAGQA